MQSERLVKAGEISNRPDDIAWAKRKIEWLWQASTARGEMPHIVVEHE